MNNIDNIKYVLNKFNNKRNDLLDRISEIENRLNEVNGFIHSTEENSQDIKFFSPYSIDDLSDNKINDYRLEANELEENLLKLTDKLNEYNDYILKLEEYIVSCETFSTTYSGNELDINNNDSLETIEENSISNILEEETVNSNHILNSLNNIKSFIKVDPNRAIESIKLLISELIK